ncbi:hypothetical protein BGW42_007845 [Actinomortierella wolfii]|nr:hypothetical protein BGW42_007845 [Actinomortierella wolfii]
MAVAIVFIAVDAYTSYNTQQDKVIREPLLKNYLLNRVFVRPSTDYRLRAARRARLRRRRRQGSVGPEAGLGPSAGGNRVTNSSSNTSTRNGSNGGEENVESFLENIDLEIQEQQMAMLDQRIRTQQRENWFLSPRIVASPDFNLADHNVALEPLPLYEPPANGIYVPPSQPPMSTTDGAPWPSTGLPRRPPPAAVADEPAPPSYDAILPIPAMAPQPSGPLPIEPQPQSGTPPSSQSQQATEAAAASSVQVTPLSSSSPSTTSPSPPPHGGQLPPAYDDIIPPPPVRNHQN